MRSQSSPLKCSKWTSLVTLAFSFTLLSSGCADDAAADCGGHGELHGSHCDCDAGYAPSADGMSCVAASTSEAEGLKGGEAHSDHDHSDHEHSNHEETGATTQGSSSAEEQGLADEQGATEGEGSDDEIEVGDEAALSFNPSTVQASSVTANDGTRAWMLEAVDGDVVLSIELYEAFGGLTTPGAAPLTSPETSYSTCGTCLILGTECVPHGDHYDCARVFMPRAEGEVRLDAIGAGDGQQLSGELLGLVFQEVTIAANYDTQIVAGGELIYLDMWAFDTTLQGSSGPEEECGGHGQMHFDHCDCDPGYTPDPQNPLNCIAQ